MCKILYGSENIDYNIFSKESKITRGHDGEDWMLESIHFPRGLDVWNILSTDCMHVSNVPEQNRPTSCEGRLHLEQYMWSLVCLSCLLPSYVFLGWLSNLS